MFILLTTVKLSNKIGPGLPPFPLYHPHPISFISANFLPISLMIMVALAIYHAWIWMAVGIGKFLFVYVLKTFSPR